MTPDVDSGVQELRPVQFEAFYSTFWAEVFKPLAATIGDRDLAREAVDEAMVRAYARWSRVRTMANPKGWVYRVAYRW
ncbi:MAG: RNA polymerase sigma factor, partial [Actinomycetota bacterium]